MEVKKTSRILLRCAGAAPAVVLLGCIGACVGVLSDMKLLWGACLAVILLSFLVMAAGFLTALFCRKWLISLGLAGLAVVSFVLCMMTAIMIGAGQHHPPRREEVADTTYVDCPEVTEQSIAEGCLADSAEENGNNYEE